MICASPGHISPITLTIETATRLRLRWELLTYRQQQVALLVINENLTYRQIAERLAISPHTVKEHLSGVYDRLGVRDRKCLRHQMIFTRELYELLENHPAHARAEEKTPPPAA